MVYGTQRANCCQATDSRVCFEGTYNAVVYGRSVDPSVVRTGGTWNCCIIETVVARPAWPHGKVIADIVFSFCEWRREGRVIVVFCIYGSSIYFHANINKAFLGSADTQKSNNNSDDNNNVDFALKSISKVPNAY